MKINTCREYKLEKVELPFNLLNLIHSFGLSLFLNELDDRRIHFEEAAVSHEFYQSKLK